MVIGFGSQDSRKNYYTIALGTCNVYLIRGESGYVLVDAGNRGREKKFLRSLAKCGIAPNEIKLIVVTHVHFDHVGSLGAIKDLCGCPVAVHNNEERLLRDGVVVLPAGTNRFSNAALSIGARLVKRGLFRFQPVKPDIIVSGKRSLSECGVNGDIIPTPGHTSGSLTVACEDGEAFVGDLAVNFCPFYPGPIYPPFADAPDRLLASWKRLIDHGVKSLNPAHGRRFGAKVLKEKYGMYTNRLRRKSE